MSEQEAICFQLLESINTDINSAYEINYNLKTEKNQLIVNNSVGLLTFSYESNYNNFIIQTGRKDNINQFITLTQGMTLVTFIETQKQLSLIQVFLWKYRQNYFPLSTKLKFIIIQANFFTEMSSLWSNLGGLSAHMGFEVQSQQQQNDFTYQVGIQIYHKSDYPSFDTINIKKQNFKFAISIKNDILLYQILLTRAALFYEEQFAHIVPIIFAINAVTLESQLKDNGIFTQDMLFQSDQIYNNIKFQIPQNYENIFHFPIHLIQFFDIKKKNCFIEFQQMCDVSYYNKVEYMCLVRNLQRNENSVISFSSRSGKSLTMYSLYYYDLFSSKQIPVYVNLTPKADEQPLYNRFSFTFDVQNLISPVRGAEYFQSYYKLINSVLDSINDSALWAQNCLQFLFNRKQNEQLQIQQIDNTYELLTVEQIFIGCLDLNFFQIQETQITTSNEKEDKINNQLDPQQINYFYDWLIQKLSIVDKQQEEEIDQINNNINLYIDECLSKQKKNYNKCLDKVLQLCKDLIKDLLELVGKKQIFDDIFQVTEKQIDITEKQLIKGQSTLLWQQIFSYKHDKIKISKITNTQQTIQLFLDEKIYIQTKATDEQKIFILLNYWNVYYDEIIQKQDSGISLIDQLISQSPQFINIKVRKVILNQFFQQIKELQHDQFHEKLENQLFLFFMSLHNPRGIETMFWKNIQYYLVVSGKDKRIKSFTQTQELYYDIDNKQQSYNDCIQITCMRQITKIKQNDEEPLSIKNRMLVAGTDFSLINFVRQNQLCYSTESSRDLNDYIQTTILSPAQCHPTIIDQFYYKQQRVSMATIEILNNQIISSVQKLNFHQYYIHMLPEKVSEMQILCALISPQIMFKTIKEKDSFLLNKSDKFFSNITINGDNTKLWAYQMYQYKQISQQIIFARQKKEIQPTDNQNKQLDEIKILKNKEFIYNFDVKDFYKRIIFIQSSVYNKEITTLFNYEISEHFFNEHSYKLETFVNNEQKIFQWKFLNECNSVLLFILNLTSSNALPIFISIRNQTSQKLFLSINVVDSDISQYSKDTDLWRMMIEKCQNMKFMFIQQSYDEYMILNDKKEKKEKKTYVEQSTALAIDSFIILLNNKKFGTGIQQIAIITVIDKQNLQNKFGIPDYLLTIISSEKNLLDDKLFENSSFTYQQNKQSKNNIFYTYQIFIEYGMHENKDLGNKICQSDIKGIIQLGTIETKIQLNNINVPLQQHLVNTRVRFQKIGDDLENDLLLKDLQGDNKELTFGQQYQIIYSWINKQQYLVKYTQIFQKLILITNFEQNILQNINGDLFQYDYIEEQIQNILVTSKQRKMTIIIYNIITKAETKLNNHTFQSFIKLLDNQVILQFKIVDSNKIQLLVISENYQGEEIPTIQNNITEKLIEIQLSNKIISRWINRQDQILKYIKNVSDIEITKQIMGQIDLNLFYFQQSVLQQINQVITRLIDTNVVRINLSFYQNIEKQKKIDDILVSDLSISQILKFLGNQIILKYDYHPIDNTFMFIVIPSQIKETKLFPLQKLTFWCNNYLENHPEDKTKPLVITYLNNFKSVNLEQIAKSVDLQFFAPGMTVEEQIKHYFKNSLQQSCPILIKILNMETQQIQQSTSIEQKGFSVDTVLQLLGISVISSSKWQKEDNVVTLKVITPCKCYYCENTDRSRLVICLDCGMHLCNNKNKNASLSHILKHIKEFQHLAFQLPNGIVPQCYKCSNKNISNLYQNDNDTITCKVHTVGDKEYLKTHQITQTKKVRFLLD